MVDRAFFRAGLQNSIILSAYKLAKYYSRPPTEFLAMRVSEVRRHLYWTNQMIEEDVERSEAERAWREAGKG